MATKISFAEIDVLEPGSPEVRLLSGADAAAFLALRLEALARHPAAFAAAFDEEADLPLAEVAFRLEHGPVFGAFLGGALVGSAGLAIPARAKKCHKGDLWGVYVREEDRGQGLGRRLVEAVIAHARGQLDQLHATVTRGNHAAHELYRSLGFQTYGLEPRGLKVGEAYFDQELLVLLLRR
ncbi:MAG TPA: GNAT family N-acetyltransferase [Geminicoccaceae bacterium]|nr:GNAT family N-acetyltransferase [Geminicoccaceae bacterium]